MVARPHRYYRTFTIPKGKKKRRIEAPRVALKVIQKWFGHYLARAIPTPDEVVGFVPNRSIMHGASRHCGATWIFSTDIENFFQSTSAKLVVEALERLGYSKHGAELIKDLTTLNGNLAQGSPASPVLSNLAFQNVDAALIDLSCELGISYTRYADDIVFSGKEAISFDLEDKVRRIVEVGNWKLSKDKTEFIEAPRRLKVYGLLVNGDKPRLTKGYRRRIRAIRHLLATEKVPAERIEEAEGHISYANSVENFKAPEN
jgi:retron-type reverse transcriptase